MGEFIKVYQIANIVLTENIYINFLFKDEKVYQSRMMNCGEATSNWFESGFVVCFTTISEY
jgi:hypothetical protein